MKPLEEYLIFYYSNPDKSVNYDMQATAEKPYVPFTKVTDKVG